MGRHLMRMRWSGCPAVAVAVAAVAAGACREPPPPEGQPPTSALGGEGPDAAPEAPTDAVAPASPRIDAGFGVACARSGEGVGVYPQTVLPDGTVLSCSNLGVAVVTGSVQVCRPDGTSTDLAAGDTAWACYLLQDRRVIVRHTGAASVVSAQGVLGILEAPFGNAYDLGDTIYTTGAPPRAYDATTYAPKPAPAVLPPAPIATCAPSPGGWWVIAAVPGGITWADPSTGVPDPAHPIVERAPYARLLVDDDCSLVIVDPPGGTRRTVRAYDRDGRLAASFALALVGETAMALDHHGGLVLSFPHTPTADVRLARVDLTTGALDPAFGTGGVAELDWPAIGWTDAADGSYSHDTLTVVGADAAGNLALQVSHAGHDAVPNAFWGGAAFARVLVDH